MILSSVLACSVVMVFVWLWAKKIRNAGVVDIFWSYNFPLIALLIMVLSDQLQPVKIIFFSMVMIWGIRLGTHLARRIVRHLDEEEGRYAQLRKDWAPIADKKFFWFFQAQAISNVLLSIPFFVVGAQNAGDISTFEYLGMVIWLIAICGEAVSDWQLDHFKKDPTNKGKVCDTGLWYYSRHPNYFFEWLIWVSYFIFALAAPWGWLAVISPLIILYLLLNVTGIPATEEQSLRSKGELYKKYQQTTSKFIPWFKKKS